VQLNLALRRLPKFRAEIVPRRRSSGRPSVERQKEVNREYVLAENPPHRIYKTTRIFLLNLINFSHGCFALVHAGHDRTCLSPSRCARNTHGRSRKRARGQHRLRDASWLCQVQVGAQTRPTTPSKGEGEVCNSYRKLPGRSLTTAASLEIRFTRSFLLFRSPTTTKHTRILLFIQKNICWKQNWGRVRKGYNSVRVWSWQL
jgi:hypothetical protein